MMLRSFGSATAVATSRKWRIAFVSVHGDPTARPGTEGVSDQNIYVHHLAKALARQGHQVDVFTRSRDGAAVRIPVDQGYQVLQVPAGPYGDIDRPNLIPHLEAFKDFVIGRHGGYDLVHSHSWLSGEVGMALAKAWRVPQIHTCHSLGAVELAAIGQTVADDDRRIPIERQVLQSVARVVVTNAEQVGAMQRLYRSQRSALEIPCGVDVTAFQPHDRSIARTLLDLHPTAPTLAYAGRFDHLQDLETMLRAVVTLRREWPIQVLIACSSRRGGADQETERRLQGLAQALNLEGNVRFLQAGSAAQVSLIYAAADVAVVPSLHEPFGLTALEAMACGRPVVASRVGGLARAVVPGECGLLVEPGNADELADSCALLLQDPLRCQRMGLRARRRVVREYTWQRVSALMSDAYGRLLSTYRHEAGGQA